MSSFRRWASVALISATLFTQSSFAVTEAEQVEVLRQVFRYPTGEWRQQLKENKKFLNRSFLDKCDQRIRWGIENNHIDDALRFSTIADFSAEIIGEKANYRTGLAEAFWKAGNTRIAREILDMVRVSSPSDLHAQFLWAGVMTELGNYPPAHSTYVELAQKGYRSAQSYYLAGQLSILSSQDTQGYKEIKKSAELGYPKAKTLLAKLDKIRASQTIMPGSFANIPIEPNRSDYRDVEAPKLDSNRDRKVTRERQVDPLTRAQSLLTTSNWQEAELYYKQAIDQNSDNTQAMIGLGALLYRKGDLYQALEILRQASEKEPTSQEAWRLLGYTYERLSDRLKGDSEFLGYAQYAFEQAHTLDPNNEKNRMNLQRTKAKRL